MSHATTIDELCKASDMAGRIAPMLGIEPQTVHDYVRQLKREGHVHAAGVLGKGGKTNGKLFDRAWTLALGVALAVNGCGVSDRRVLGPILAELMRPDPDYGSLARRIIVEAGEGENWMMRADVAGHVGQGGRVDVHIYNARVPPVPRDITMSFVASLSLFVVNLGLEA